MLNFVRRLLRRWITGGGGAVIDYRVPVGWFESQLGGDLLDTGFYWVWTSRRSFPAANRGLPDERPMTVLSLIPGRAGQIGADAAECDAARDEQRLMWVFGAEAPIALDHSQLKAAMNTFISSGAGPLVAVLFQHPHDSPHLFLPKTSRPELSRVLETWAERLGRPPGELEHAPGGRMLKALWVGGVIEQIAFPALPATREDSGPAGHR